MYCEESSPLKAPSGKFVLCGRIEIVRPLQGWVGAEVGAIVGVLENCKKKLYFDSEPCVGTYLVGVCVGVLENCTKRLLVFEMLVTIHGWCFRRTVCRCPEKAENQKVHVFSREPTGLEIQLGLKLAS